MNNIFFSIIVVSLNAEETIGKTVDSVLSQSFDNYEIIVKDAKSSDGTLSSIPEDPKIRVYSRNDGGIYFGMNEAVEYAQGEYLCFLNCGDFFENKDVLKNAFDCISKNANIAIAYGDYKRKDVVYKQPDNITSFYLFRTPLCHQSMFFKRDLFSKYGNYNTEFRICADWDLTLKAYRNNEKFLRIPFVVCDYMGQGASETKKGREAKHREYERIQKEYYSAKEIRKYRFRLFFSMRKLRALIVSDKSPKIFRKAYRAIVNRIN